MITSRSSPTRPRVSEAPAGDDLLRWSSEVGSGSWNRLRDACAYLTERYSLRLRPWTLASRLSSLGHIEIDWNNQRWSVAPPTINVVPGLGLCTVLTGSRPYHLGRRFEKATDDLDVFPFDIPQHPNPTAKYAKCASVEVAIKVAVGMEALLVFDPASALIDALRSIEDNDLLEAAPAPPLEEASRFNGDSLGWDKIHDRSPGLYRVDLHGRPVHRWLDDHGRWWELDLATGQFLAIRTRQAPVCRWQGSTSQAFGQFEVRGDLSLPILAERALTVSSGLLPTVSDKWRSYHNIPRLLAEKIAHKLHCHLQMTHKG